MSRKHRLRLVGFALLVGTMLAAGGCNDFHLPFFEKGDDGEDLVALASNESVSGSQNGTEVGPAGGTVEGDGVTIEVGPDVLVGPVAIRISPAAEDLPPFPVGFVAAGAPMSIEISDPGLIDAPLIVRMRHTVEEAADLDRLVVLHLDGETWELATVIATDSETVTVASRVFSDYAPALLEETAIPAGPNTTGFRPDRDGFQIENFGAFFAPSGCCLGMSAFAVWFFQNRSTGMLYSHFPGTDADEPTSTAHILALRAQIAQSKAWSQASYFVGTGDELTHHAVALKIRASIGLFGAPAILLMHESWYSWKGHAVVAYGYDDRHIWIYDPNHPNRVDLFVPIEYEQGMFGGHWTFGSYTNNSGTYRRFGFAAPGLVGRKQDLATLDAEAEAGFAESRFLRISSPLDGEDLGESGCYVPVEGNLGAFHAEAVVAYGTGSPNPEQLEMSGSDFEGSVPIQDGRNMLVVLGVQKEAQTHWYPNSTVQVLYFEAEAPAVAFRVDTAVDGTIPGDPVDKWPSPRMYVEEPQGDRLDSWRRRWGRAGRIDTLLISHETATPFYVARGCPESGFGTYRFWISVSDVPLEATLVAKVFLQTSEDGIVTLEFPLQPGDSGAISAGEVLVEEDREAPFGFTSRLVR